MIEFGAGGNITQAVEGGVTLNDGGNPANPATPGTATASPPVTPATNHRRKRKAKGWFCPVCRQRKCTVLAK